MAGRGRRVVPLAIATLVALSVALQAAYLWSAHAARQRPASIGRGAALASVRVLSTVVGVGPDRPYDELALPATARAGVDADADDDGPPPGGWAPWDEAFAPSFGLRSFEHYRAQLLGARAQLAPNQSEVVLAARVRGGEERHLCEWVQFHRWVVGVESFLLLHTNCSDEAAAIGGTLWPVRARRGRGARRRAPCPLAELAAAGVLTAVRGGCHWADRFHGRPRARAELLARARERAHWLGLVSVDEYVVPAPPAASGAERAELGALLGEHARRGHTEVVLGVRTFGTSYHRLPPAASSTIASYALRGALGVRSEHARGARTLVLADACARLAPDGSCALYAHPQLEPLPCVALVGELACEPLEDGGGGGGGGGGGAALTRHTPRASLLRGSGAAETLAARAQPAGVEAVYPGVRGGGVGNASSAADATGMSGPVSVYHYATRSESELRAHSGRAGAAPSVPHELNDVLDFGAVSALERALQRAAPLPLRARARLRCCGELDEGGSQGSAQQAAAGSAEAGEAAPPARGGAAEADVRARLRKLLLAGAPTEAERKRALAEPSHWKAAKYTVRLLKLNPPVQPNGAGGGDAAAGALGSAARAALDGASLARRPSLAADAGTGTPSEAEGGATASSTAAHIGAGGGGAVELEELPGGVIAEGRLAALDDDDDATS